MEHGIVAGELIREARRRTGLSQAELARRAGMTRSVLNSYERGRRQPGVDALARVLEAAGLELRVYPNDQRVAEERAGRALAQVLGLADALPHPPRRELGYPPLKHAAP
jgi:transcriptional regulator with XRE-family HTH domain